jgi:hypothetical protein
MDLTTLTTFFMWCTIINVGLLLSWALVWLTIPNLVYRIHTMWFDISRKDFELVFYCFMGVFKVFFLIFCLVPWLVLLIIG